MAEVRYPAGLRVPVHTHDHPHLGFLLEGHCRETVGRRAFEYERFSLVVKQPGESHSNRAGPSGTRFLIVDVADPSRAPGVFEERIQLRDGRILPLAARLREELELRDPASALALEGLVLELFAEIARRRTRARSGGPAWIDRARELLRDTLREERSLRSLRVERALQLLAETDRPLAEVADEAGYCDQSHLTRALRHATGATPGAYRRRLRAWSRGRPRGPGVQSPSQGARPVPDRDAPIG